MTGSALPRIDLDQTSGRYSGSAYKRSTSLRRQRWVPLPSSAGAPAAMPKCTASRNGAREPENDAGQHAEEGGAHHAIAISGFTRESLAVERS